MYIYIYKCVYIYIYIYIYIGNIRTDWYRNYKWRVDIIQNLCELWLVFWAENALITQCPKYHRGQNVSILPSYILLLSVDIVENSQENNFDKMYDGF